MNFKEIIEKRYSAKAFTNKRVSQEDLDVLYDSLQKAASSINIQPWHFLVAHSDEAKKKVANACAGPFSMNMPKVLNSSETFVFCAKKDLDKDFIKSIVDQEREDKRFLKEEDAVATENMMINYVEGRKDATGTANDWINSQVYLNAGSFLVTLSGLNIDAAPMEGFNPDTLSKEFNLEVKGLRPVLIVSIGYHSEDDFNAKLKKSRLSKDKVITVL